MRNTILLAMALACSACSTGAPDRFYRLEAVAPKTTASSNLRVEVAQASLPAMLDRPQMVFASAGSASVSIAEQSRWAEPLAQGISRVLAQDLSSTLGSPYVLAYPQVMPGLSQVRVSLDVRSFDASQGGVELDALWSVRPLAPGTDVPAVQSGHSHIRVVVEGAGAGAIVAAQSSAIGRLANELTPVILALPATSPASTVIR